MGSEKHTSGEAWAGDATQESLVLRGPLQPNVEERREDRGLRTALWIQSPRMEGRRGRAEGAEKEQL